jgi:hypothetical protein
MISPRSWNNERGVVVGLIMSRARLLASVAAVAALAAPAAADTVDAPTQQRGTLRGTSHASGALTAELGFPAHTYRASRDGFARVELTTANVRDTDNGGRAWRPFLRIVTVPTARRRGEGWSTNGQPGDPGVGRAALIVRVQKGEEFTVVATVGQNMIKGKPGALARYTLAVTELGE